VVYINRKKIERAQLMLLQGNKTIKEVAYALAFDNISYFNKQFKRILGKTPTLYIKESSLIR
jgi:YesN/AraC family two-component response regulator